MNQGRSQQSNYNYAIMEWLKTLKNLFFVSKARTINQSTGHDTSGKPTGQGYGAARKGPGVRGPVEAQVKEEPREYKNNA